MWFGKSALVILAFAVLQCIDALPVPKDDPAPQTCDVEDRLLYSSEVLQSSYKVTYGGGRATVAIPKFWSKQGWINYNSMESLLNAGAFYPDQTYKNKDFKAGNFITTVDQKQVTTLTQTIWGQSYGSMGTDDYGWKALLALAAYRLENSINKDSDAAKMWLGRAKDTYDKYLGPYWDKSSGGGGVMWKLKGDNYRSTISTELYISVAAMLHDAGSGDSYLDDAKKAHDWLFSTDYMKTPEGLFYDGWHPGDKGGANNPDREMYTYNQAVILSGLGYLYKATNDDKYMEEGLNLVGVMFGKNGMTEDEGKLVIAERCDKQTISDLVDQNNKVKGSKINYCDENGSYFKGAYMKHLTYFFRLIPQEKAMPFHNFVQANANAAWSASLGNDAFSNIWIGTDTDNFKSLKNSFPGVADTAVFDALIATIDFGNTGMC